jgi:seryl-tRNA synthetase
MDYTEFEKTFRECRFQVNITRGNTYEINVIFPNEKFIKIIPTNQFAGDVRNDVRYDEVLFGKDRKIEQLKGENEKLKSDLEYFENSHQQIVAELNYNIDEITTSRETISKLNTTLADVLMKYADLLDKMVEVNKHEH